MDEKVYVSFAIKVITAHHLVWASRSQNYLIDIKRYHFYYAARFLLNPLTKKIYETFPRDGKRECKV